jgi:hypothetical protein
VKLLSVVCRVTDDDGKNDRLHNIEPADFLDMLSAATEGEAEDVDDLAALQAELDASRKPAKGEAAPPPPQPTAAATPKVVGGDVVLPHAAFDPLIGAKTRGELFDAVNALLSQFGARIANAGEL